MSLQTGARLGPYEVLASLGAGGMGEVYRARDTRLKRDVAIKILPATFAGDADRLARFQREAEVLASLNHPHIAAIYGIEESSGVPALVLELVEGDTLADRLRHGAVAIEEALAIAIQIAQALEAAHDRGIIHRDLKPANVKLSADRTVKVLDFGLAKALDSTAGIDSGGLAAALTNPPTLAVAGTGAGVLLGTAAYMSPEQARGQTLDARSDIWAFGCLLSEMLTGRMTFTGPTTTDILASIVRQEPDWSALPSATPEHVRRLLHRCLAKDLRHRLRHIGDARLELEEGPWAPAAASPEIRSRERIAWAIATALALGLAGMVAVLATRSRSATNDAPIISRFTRLTSGPAHESAPAISPDGKWVAYLSNARGPTDVWVKFIAGGDPVNLTASVKFDVQSQTDLGGLAISPDGTSIAFDGGDAAIGPSSYGAWLIPAPMGGVPRKFVNGRAVRWSPDGTKIAYMSAGGSAGDALWVADADGGNAREIAPRRGGIHKHWVSWSRDGRYLYFNNSINTSNSEPAEIYRVAVSGGPIEPIVTTARRAVFPALMPDGGGLIYAANPDTADLSLWWKSFRRPAAAAERLTTGVGEYAEPNVSADGRSIVATLVDVRESLVALPLRSAPTDPATIPITNGYTGDLDPVFSPSGDRLVFSSTRAGNRNLWTSNPDGSAARPLTSGTAIDERPAFSPDGQQLAFVSDRGGRRGIWLMNAEGGAARLLATAEALDTISWSRDGSRIVFAVSGDEPELRTVTLADGAIHPLNTPRGGSAPAWSPRADVIAYLENLPAGRNGRITLHIAFVNADGTPVHQGIDAPNLGNGAVAWDATGERIAVIGNSGVILKSTWIFDPTGRQAPQKVMEFPADARLRGVTWARDGQSLVIGQHRGVGDIVLFELAKR